MQSGLSLLNHLETEDINWLFDTGNELQIIANTKLIQYQEVSNAMYFVLEGLLGVSVPDIESDIARLGPGELVGEMSFLEKQEASATVAAVENSLVLEIPFDALYKHLEEDPHFAARIYRGFALFGFKRLRASVNNLAQLYTNKDKDKKISKGLWGEISPQIDVFKEKLFEADKAAVDNYDEVPEALTNELIQGFSQFSVYLNQLIGFKGTATKAAKDEIGARVQRELLPYITMSTLGDRIFAKPRGYAGDFLTIEIMYQNKATGTGRLGPVIDQAFRLQPANIAVMNRRGLLAEEIGKTMAAITDRQVLATSLASGPAAELFDVFETLENKRRLKATCIDIDLQALAFVGDKRDRLKLKSQMNLFNGNLVYLATGRQELNIPPQDLMYSIGLIDYFNDKFVILLLNYIYDCLAPGGRVILGNFHTDNPNKALMDYIIEWELIHRDEDDMNRLFQESKFARPCTNIRYEEQRVNLFAECIKA